MFDRDVHFATDFLGFLQIGLMTMHLVHWFAVHEIILALLVTAGVGVLIISCVGCSNCPSRDKDDIFRRRDL